MNKSLILAIFIVLISGCVGCKSISPIPPPCNEPLIRKRVIVATKDTQIITPWKYYIPMRDHEGKLFYIRIPELN